MPELPEVETVVRELRAGGLVGRVITRARAFWKPMIAPLPPQIFAARLKGRRIQSIHRRAKYIVITLSNGEAPRGSLLRRSSSGYEGREPRGNLLRRSSISYAGQVFAESCEAKNAIPPYGKPQNFLAKKDDTLLIHLRMTGQLSLVHKRAPRDLHQHIVLRLDDGRDLRYRDTRKFGRWILTRAPAGILGRLGPEPLSDHFDRKEFFARLRARRRQLKPLLLDQTFLAGIGNIYADEALWDARLHPGRVAATLTATEAHRLHGAIRRVLLRGIRNRGTTLGHGRSNFQRPGGKRGRNQEGLNVFRRTGSPCLRCGKPICRMIISQRSTHLCHHCQPMQNASLSSRGYKHLTSTSVAVGR